MLSARLRGRGGAMLAACCAPLLLGACAGGSVTSGGPAGAVSGGAVPAADSGAFVLTIGKDTFAVERFTRSDTALVGELTGAQLGTIRYDAALTPDALVPRLESRFWPPGTPDTGAPAQHAVFSLPGGDSATLEMAGQTQRLATRPGALPYANPSFALVEQLLRRARRPGADHSEIPVLMTAGGATLPATVTWADGDSVTLAIAGVGMRVRFDAASGRLLGAEVPAQRLRVERVAPEAVRARFAAAAAPMPPPDYSAPPGAPYTAEEVSIPTPGRHALAGTLTLPQGATGTVPAVVLISGSGAQDRDSAIPGIAGYRPFRQIADTLSRRGIAVLRLDDRGVGGSGPVIPTTTSADLAADVRAALAWLRTRPEIDGKQLGLIGHSEGAIIAPMVAVEEPSVHAVVLIAGSAEPGRAIVEAQNRYLLERAGHHGAKLDSLLAEAMTKVDSLAAEMPWYGYFIRYDPLPTARRLRVPALVLQGATDRQVPAAQAEALAAAIRRGGERDVTQRIFPDLNHLLLPDPSGDPLAYTTLRDTKVPAEVLGVLADWVAAKLGR